MMTVAIIHVRFGTYGTLESSFFEEALYGRIRSFVKTNHVQSDLQGHTKHSRIIVQLIPGPSHVQIRKRTVTSIVVVVVSNIIILIIIAAILTQYNLIQKRWWLCIIIFAIAVVVVVVISWDGCKCSCKGSCVAIAKDEMYILFQQDDYCDGGNIMCRQTRSINTAVQQKQKQQKT
jgi:hypothetical protein